MLLKLPPLFYTDRFINSIKTALAVLLGLIFYHIYQLPKGQWIIVTILMVMGTQASFGGTLIKSYMRLLGTFSGAIISVITLLLFGDNMLAITVVMIIFSLIFAYIAGSPTNLSNAGTLGAATMTVILLTPNPTLVIAGIRFIEITIGILIALIVSKLIFPIHAHIRLVHNVKSTFENLKNFYQASIIQTASETDHKHHDILDEKILAAFTTQRKLISEATAELSKTQFKKTIFEKLIIREQKIYRTINLMEYSLTTSKTSAKIIFNIENLQQFNEEILKNLAILASALQSKQPITLSSELHQFRKEIEVKISSMSKEYSFDDIVNVHSFLFCMRYLILQIERIAELIKEFK